LAVSTKEEPYVQFARLKGVPNWNRMTGYVFRNALLPQVTALVLSLGTIFNGALLTEMIFSYPGVGLLMRTAAGAGDYNLLYGSITLSIVAVATAAFISTSHPCLIHLRGCRKKTWFPTKAVKKRARCSN
jgi:peptide/nickel transport system permease protein